MVRGVEVQAQRSSPRDTTDTTPEERIHTGLLAALVFQVCAFAIGWVGEFRQGLGLHPRILLPALSLVVLALALWKSVTRPVGATYVAVAWFLLVEAAVPDADATRIAGSFQLLFLGVMAFTWVNARRLRRKDKTHP